MARIIHYEKKLYENEGAFIDPYGKIIFTYGQHLGFAINYYRGRDYDYLSRLRYGRTYDPNAFEEYKNSISLSELLVTEALFSFKYPINCDTLNLSGIHTYICM